MSIPEHWRRSALRMVGMEPGPIRTLADETQVPDPAIVAEFIADMRQLPAPGTPSRCATCARPITWKTSHMWGDRWTHDGIAEDAGDHEPTPTTAGRWEPRTIEDAMAPFEEGVLQRYRDERVTADLHALDDRRSLEDKYLAVCQQLREVTADRDRLEHVNDGLRTALAELGRRLDAAGPLRVADDGLLIGPYGTEAGR